MGGVSWRKRTKSGFNFSFSQSRGLGASYSVRSRNKTGMGFNYNTKKGLTLDYGVQA